MSSVPDRAAAEAIPFAEMVSACPSTSVDAAHRLDPYWFGLWTGGTQVSWNSRGLAHRLDAAGMVRQRRDGDRVDPEQAMAAMCVPKLRARRCAVMAAIGLWRTLTAEQIAAIVGVPALVKSAADLRTAWSAGLVEEGRFALAVGDGRYRKNRNTVYRPVNSPAFTRFAAALPYNEWLSVTSGRPWRSGSDLDRHNLLAAELGLRVAEFAEVGTVFGETLSGFDLLSAHPGAPGGVVGTGQHADADLTCAHRRRAHRRGAHRVDGPQLHPQGAEVGAAVDGHRPRRQRFDGGVRGGSEPGPGHAYPRVEHHTNHGGERRVLDSRFDAPAGAGADGGRPVV